MSLFADERDPPSISGVWDPRGSVLLADCARGGCGEADRLAERELVR